MNYVVNIQLINQVYDSNIYVTNLLTIAIYPREVKQSIVKLMTVKFDNNNRYFKSFNSDFFK